MICRIWSTGSLVVVRVLSSRDESSDNCHCRGIGLVKVNLAATVGDRFSETSSGDSFSERETSYHFEG